MALLFTWGFFVVVFVVVCVGFLFCFFSAQNEGRSGEAGGFAVSLERNWWNSEALSALSAKAALIERYPMHRAISSLRQAALSGCLRRNPGLGAAP